MSACRLEKLALIGRALEKIERFDDGRLAVTYISNDDYEATGAGEVHTEGVIDFLRSLEGARVAAVIRDKTDGGRSARKVSMRSNDGAVDVSLIARREGGGGHRRAAGFGSDLPTTSSSRSSEKKSPLSSTEGHGASSSSTSRPGSRRTTPSHARSVRSGSRRVTRARWTRSRPGC